MSGLNTSRSFVFGIILSMFLLGPTALSAQKKGYSEGYVISLEGDTLHGFVKDRREAPFEELYPRVRFKKKGAFKKKYSPNEIKGYGYNESHFESVPISEEVRFFRFDYQSHPEMPHVFLRVARRYPNLILYEWEYVQDDNSYLDSFPLFYRPDQNKWVRVTQGIFGLKRKKLVPFFLDCPQLALGIQNKTINTLYDILEMWEGSCLYSSP
ncbi:hypothetical protein [Robiginitalea sp.]|uniref:hypothetical protein n=1 Tax=Robiginitalea sp. TaxID=1902411 RepID=UPI003C77963D